jgi:hypothetical protein
VWQRVHDARRDRVRLHAGRDPLPTAAVVESQTVCGADIMPPTSAGYDAGKESGAANDTSSPTPTL